MIYIGKCVEWPTDDVYSDGGLCDMIDQALEKQLGYESHPKKRLTMSGDYHVRYFA